MRNEAERDRIEKAPDEAGGIAIRDRIRELRRVRARDLVPHPKNWRKHPRAQAAALRGLLTEIGYADALLVRELRDGALMIIDGHLAPPPRATARWIGASETKIVSARHGAVSLKFIAMFLT
jgi:hypothetical protein